MKLHITVLLIAASTTLAAPVGYSQTPAQGQIWHYALLTDAAEVEKGSYLVDDCPPCGRPTILQPMRGTFNLALLEGNPLFSRYELRDISFLAGRDASQEYKIIGGGQYQFGGEVALTQDMTLQVNVNNGLATKLCFFTNVSRAVERPWPVIQIDLDQTNGTFTQVYRLHLVAEPMREPAVAREIWFSTASGFTSGNSQSPTNRGSGGDLLSSTGRIVKSNAQLLERLGLPPGAADLNIDALDIGPGGEIFFSLDKDVASDTLGSIHHGDLLSDRGRIVKRNQELTAAFAPMPVAPDVGLDAVQIKDDGEILFSTTANIFGEAGGWIYHGDIASSRGTILKRNQELRAQFHPPDPKHDYGLDALYVWPSGEIWFSLEEGFADQQLGAIRAGDLLSDAGTIVFRNLDLMNAFAPLEDLADFGLDALFVVADSTPPASPPSFLAIPDDRQNGNLTLRWEGKGRVFQLETADQVSGPYQPFSPIMPDLFWNHTGALNNKAQNFYRLRQW